MRNTLEITLKTEGEADRYSGEMKEMVQLFKRWVNTKRVKTDVSVEEDGLKVRNITIEFDDLGEDDYTREKLKYYLKQQKEKEQAQLRNFLTNVDSYQTKPEKKKTEEEDNA